MNIYEFITENRFLVFTMWTQLLLAVSFVSTQLTIALVRRNKNE